MQVERKVLVRGRFGLHLRAAGRFAEVANGFRSAISVFMAGRQVDGKSILDMLTLGATSGSELVIRVEGDDAEKALDALAELFEEPAAGRTTAAGKEP
jgi:phosphotransferase system HPr (HPr) family protein